MEPAESTKQYALGGGRSMVEDSGVSTDSISLRFEHPFAKSTPKRTSYEPKLTRKAQWKDITAEDSRPVRKIQRIKGRRLRAGSFEDVDARDNYAWKSNQNVKMKSISFKSADSDDGTVTGLAIAGGLAASAAAGAVVGGIVGVILAPAFSNPSTPTLAPTISPAPTILSTTRVAEGRLGYTFFETTTVREPTTEEINGLVVETDAFYDMVLQMAYPTTYIAGSAMLTNIAETFDAAETFPVILDFDLMATFSTDEATAPTTEEIFAVMFSANYQDYLQNHVWIAEPQGDSLFFDTERVSFTNRGGDVGNRQNAVTAVVNAITAMVTRFTPGPKQQPTPPPSTTKSNFTPQPTLPPSTQSPSVSIQRIITNMTNAQNVSDTLLEEIPEVRPEETQDALREEAAKKTKEKLENSLKDKPEDKTKGKPEINTNEEPDDTPKPQDRNVFIHWHDGEEGPT
ncbi:expressed unknown protein [Seminavis robusta]|uniref:Uncharacterized protein n=1 Tax=Seminavis robusta TaxID=568900 RepID=A0A9N8EA87_9STRA|nr:expressed unknown protein [Seminavis robusta]|eukprot:Sro668_g184370.1 n/a (457) ;mRNA; f:35115-36485